MRPVIFRFDKSSDIGNGHAFRCLTLANMFHSKGHPVKIVTRGKLNFEGLTSGFDIVEFATSNKIEFDPNNYVTWLGEKPGKDCDDLIQFISKCDEFPFVILDHYGINQEYETKIKEKCHKLIVIDDLIGKNHDCDVLINQNSYANDSDTYPNLKKSKTKLLMGIDYAILRDEFFDQINYSKKEVENVSNVLVSLGGIQEEELLKVLNSLKKVVEDDQSITVVSNYSEQLEKVFKKSFTFHPFVQDIWSLMSKCDLAIGAAGTSSYERIALNIPSIVFTLAENQIPVAESCSELGVCKYFGHLSDLDEDLLVNEFEKCFKDVVKINEMKKSCDKLVKIDGKLNIYNALMHEDV